jgi:hypothetical protein
MYILNFKEWLLNEVNLYLPIEEFFRRLELLGWKQGSRNGSHVIYYAPPNAIPVSGTGGGSGRGIITIAINDENYQRNFFSMQRNIFKQFPDIKTFFNDQIFSVPKNFDIETQSFVEEKPEKVKVSVLYNRLIKSGDSPDVLIGQEINGKTVEMASFDSGKLELIYTDGSASDFNFGQDIVIKKTTMI